MRDRYELYVLARELGQERRAPVERQWCTALRLPTGMGFESPLVTKGREMVRQSRLAGTIVKIAATLCNAGSIPATSTITNSYKLVSSSNASDNASTKANK